MGIMTLNQLQTLTDDELAIALYVVNHLSPPGIPPGPFDARDLTWFKHLSLVQKLVDSFSKLKPEGHAVYKSLMEKLGVKIEINPIPQSPEPPPSGSV
jgi:hypothetical protein